MRKRLYSNLAWDNVKKNYRFFIPRILSEAGLLACFYISVTLWMDKNLQEMHGGEYISFLMAIGTIVLALLSLILMLYTNSFLMKQRKKEFGLYNILGLEKKHVGKIMFFETFYCNIFSIALGLLTGIVFYKLCSVLICRLLQTTAVAGFYYLKPLPVIAAGGFFILLDLFIYTINRIKLANLNPIELMQSKSAGEKEPKVKIPMLIIGLIALGAGYFMALALTDPLKVIGLFLVAVILVIIGTYFLFVTGSTFVLKLLKKREKYYYTAKHMPAVSGLLYRMKQNAVGLASIAILSTGVLVMISTTVSLYAGYNEVLNKNYPQHIYMNVAYETEDGKIANMPEDDMISIVKKAAEKNNAKIKSIGYDEYLYVAYVQNGNSFYGTNETDVSPISNNIVNLIFITRENYENLTGTTLQLSDTEVATCRVSSPSSDVREIDGTFNLHGNNYKVKKILNIFPINCNSALTAYPTYGIVVSGQKALDVIFAGQKRAYGEHASDYTKRICVTFNNIDNVCQYGDEISKDIRTAVNDYIKLQPGISKLTDYTIDTYWNAKSALLGMYGTFLFLGILLGTVCMFATVLIIYYKQISEGYEDRSRFQIMEKIGMSRKEVKKTINSQVLLVFFLPIAVAGIHLAFAFPMLLRLLKILWLTNTSLFLICALVTFTIFAFIYTLIYKGTSKTYFKIVH